MQRQKQPTLAKKSECAKPTSARKSEHVLASNAKPQRKNNNRHKPASKGKKCRFGFVYINQGQYVEIAPLNDTRVSQTR